jgi:LytS/YehU family sensor histidine kinase
MPVWLYVTLFWLLLSVIYASQLLLITPRPAAAVLGTQLIWQTVYYLAWAPLTPIIWRVTRSWEIERLGWPSFLLRHAVAGVVVSGVHAALVVAVSMPVVPIVTEPMATVWSAYVRARLHMQLLIYAAIVGAGQAMGFHNRYRERQVAAARLEAQLAAARLHSLRAQLQPHFLFNSLHSMAALARAGDTAGVVRLVSDFSELLRHLLDTNVTHHTVREEFALVARYLDIQRVRFGDRLRVSIEADGDAAGGIVPLFVVQPLVENSLRHGLAPRIEPGYVSVRAIRDGRSLVVEVTDNGAGLPAEWSLAASAGTGLRNLASRLDAEFGSGQSMTVAPRPGGGVHVTVRLPYTAG